MADETARIRLEPLDTAVLLRHGHTTLARTRDGQRLFETGYPMRIYLAKAAVDAVFIESAKRTHCPYKGDARYFDVTVDGQTLHDAAWSYGDPIESMRAIAGLVCFDHPQLELVLDGA